MTQPLQLNRCYALAWKSFAKWWIPLCLISGILMVFEQIPKQLAKPETSAMIEKVRQFAEALKDEDYEAMDAQLFEFNEILVSYSKKLFLYSLYAAPLVALLAVLLVSASLMAVKNKRTMHAPFQIVLITFVHLFLAVVKVLLIFLILPLGLFIYVKLSFVSLLMLEEKDSPTQAIRGSWEMTAGNFWPLFGMIALNGTLQMLSLPTIIGFIPATGFANTARAAAFSMLREPSQ